MSVSKMSRYARIQGKTCFLATAKLAIFATDMYVYCGKDIPNTIFYCGLRCASPYHPESNAMIESLHRRLKESLIALGHESPREWYWRLPCTLLIWRTTLKPNIGACIPRGSCMWRRPHDPRDIAPIRTFKRR